MLVEWNIYPLSAFKCIYVVFPPPNRRVGCSQLPRGGTKIHQFFMIFLTKCYIRQLSSENKWIWCLTRPGVALAGTLLRPRTIQKDQSEIPQRPKPLTVICLLLEYCTVRYYEIVIGQPCVEFETHQTLKVRFHWYQSRFNQSLQNWNFKRYFSYRCLLVFFPDCRVDKPRGPEASGQVAKSYPSGHICFNFSIFLSRGLFWHIFLSSLLFDQTRHAISVCLPTKHLYFFYSA